MEKFFVEIPGQDSIEIEVQNQKLQSLKVIACTELLELLQSYKSFKNTPLSEWPMPEGNKHSHLLLKELLLKAQGKWQHPYPHTELCHCRKILTETVDAAIIRGAHTTDSVSRLTSASTACGTCRPHVQDLIDFRLSHTKESGKPT